MQTKRITTNIKQVIANKQKLNAATYVITGNSDFYVLSGERIKTYQLELMLPIEPKKYFTNL